MYPLPDCSPGNSAQPPTGVEVTLQKGCPEGRGYTATWPPYPASSGHSHTHSRDSGAKQKQLIWVITLRSSLAPSSSTSKCFSNMNALKLCHPPDGSEKEGKTQLSDATQAGKLSKLFPWGLKRSPLREQRQGSAHPSEMPREQEHSLDCWEMRTERSVRKSGCGKTSLLKNRSV